METNHRHRHHDPDGDCSHLDYYVLHGAIILAAILSLSGIG